MSYDFSIFQEVQAAGLDLKEYTIRADSPSVRMVLNGPKVTVHAADNQKREFECVEIVGGFNPPTPRRWRFASVAEMAAVMLPLKKEQEREAKRRANGGGSGGIREV